MEILAAYLGRAEHDPALLAFVKCHLTSFERWEVLRLLAQYGERWTDASEVAGELHRPVASIAETLAGLFAECLVEARRSPDGSIAYRMDPLEPSTRVVERLVLAATRSQELRQIIIARVLGASRAAS